MQKWRPQGVIRGGRFASHCRPDLVYGHPGALRSIHIRSGFALRYAKMAPARDHPPRSPRFALRCGPDIRTSWCPAQHLNPQWACHDVRYAKKEAARGHPPRSHRFALRRRPGVRTSWCAVQQPHLRGRLASHCGPDVGCGHPGVLHRIHIRNAFAKLTPARYDPPRSPRFALRHRPRIRTSWCSSQHRHPQWACHAVRYAKKEAARGHPPRSQTWRADILVRCTAARSPRPARFALRPRRGLRTSWCPASHPHSQWACHDVRDAKKEAARGHPPRSHRFALRRRPGMRTSWCAVQQPDLRGRLASPCGLDVGCGHPGALHRIHIRNAFAKMVPARYHPPRSPRFALRHRCVRTSWCPAQHPHPQWVCHTLSGHGAQNGSSAAVASLRTAAQTWRTDILVPCTASTSAMGLPYGF